MSWNIAIKRSIIKALPEALRELAEPVGFSTFYALDKVTACVAMIDETSPPIRSGPEPDLDAR